MRIFEKVPKFKSEAEEAKFWETHDTTVYVDWKRAERTIFPNLKPSSRAIPIKLPMGLLESLKYLAHKRHTSYQALLRAYVESAVYKELNVK